MTRKRETGREGAGSAEADEEKRGHVRRVQEVHVRSLLRGRDRLVSGNRFLADLLVDLGKKKTNTVCPGMTMEKKQVQGSESSYDWVERVPIDGRDRKTVENRVDDSPHRQSHRATWARAAS